MSIGNAQAIYNAIFAGDRVRVALANEKEFHTLRTTLCKLNKNPRFLLEVTDDSVCANWHKEESVGEFWLGTPRISASKHYEFTVQECDATK